MTSYWITNNGRGAYCAGFLNDPMYNRDTCVLVSAKPSEYHIWNGSSWEESRDRKLSYIRSKRNVELTRTDKYVLSDYYATFTNDQKTTIITYRQALRDCTLTLVLPTCPDFMTN